jgi:hypothetical protein
MANTTFWVVTTCESPRNVPLILLPVSGDFFFLLLFDAEHGVEIFLGKSGCLQTADSCITQDRVLNCLHCEELISIPAFNRNVTACPLEPFSILELLSVLKMLFRRKVKWKRFTRKTAIILWDGHKYVFLRYWCSLLPSIIFLSRKMCKVVPVTN